LEEVPNVLHADDGFALIDQWVQGGTLNQEGTLFVNVEGNNFQNNPYLFNDYAQFSFKRQNIC
jgi:hypothetical protein